MSETNGSVVTERVIVATPNESWVGWQCYENHLDMAHHLGWMGRDMVANHTNPTYEFRFWSIGRIFTPAAREALCDVALQSNATYILMVDNDMLYPRDLFFKLVRHQKDIVAPLAFTRRPPHVPVMYICREGYDDVTHQDYFQNVAVRHYPDNALVRCDAVGFGAALIHTRVLKAMKKPWFMSATGSGEDLYFCYKAKRLGFECYMDTSIKTGHLADGEVITEESAKNLWKQNGFDHARHEHFVKYQYVPLPHETEWVQKNGVPA